MFGRKKKAALHQKREGQAAFRKNQEHSEGMLSMMQSMAGPAWDDPSALQNVDDGPLSENDQDWWKGAVGEYTDPMESIVERRKAERAAELKALGSGSIGDGSGKIASRGYEGEGRDVRDMVEDPRFAMIHSGSKKEKQRLVGGGLLDGSGASLAQATPFVRTIHSGWGTAKGHSKGKMNDSIGEDAKNKSTLAANMASGFAVDRRRDRNVGVGKTLLNLGKDAMFVASLGASEAASTAGETMLSMAGKKGVSFLAEKGVDKLGDKLDVRQDKKARDKCDLRGRKAEATGQNHALMDSFGVQGKKRKLRTDGGRKGRESMLQYLGMDELSNSATEQKVPDEDGEYKDTLLEMARSIQGDGRSKAQRKAETKASSASTKQGNKQRHTTALEEATDKKRVDSNDPEAKLGWRERGRAKRAVGKAEGEAVSENNLRPSMVARLDRGEQARQRERVRMGAGLDDDMDLLERLDDVNG